MFCTITVWAMTLFDLEGVKFWGVGALTLGYGVALWNLLTERKEGKYNFPLTFQFLVGRAFVPAWGVGIVTYLALWQVFDDTTKALHVAFPTVIVVTCGIQFAINTMWYLSRHLHRLQRLEEDNLITADQKRELAEEAIRVHFKNLLS